MPYPLHSGGHVRLYNLIRELSEKHDITLVCEKRPHQTASDIKEVERICKKVITVERRKQWSLQNVAKSAFSPHSFLVTGHTHFEMQKKIQEELEQNSFDLIHVETFYVMQNLMKVLGEAYDGDDARFVDGLRQTSDVKRYRLRNRETNDDIPIVLVEHNIEYLVYQKFVDRAPAAMRPLLSLDVAKIKREEALAWKQATALVTVSEEDKRVMQQAGFTATIVSNGVDIESFAFKQRIKNPEQKMKKLLFIGDFKWIQNQDSAKFIIQEIWPLIRQQVTSDKQQVKLWIVAREIPDSILNLTDDSDVIFDVESSNKPTPEIFKEASVLLAPIRVGGGTSYKILESMACGTPVVTMQMSASAIHAEDGKQIMVGQTAEDLAEKTIHLLQNEEFYERIAQNGRKLIEEKYSWKEIGRELEKVYNSLLH